MHFVGCLDADLNSITSNAIDDDRDIVVNYQPLTDFSAKY